MIVLSKTTHFCKQCGDPLVIIPKTKPKKFCSGDCRNLWWNAHPEEMSYSPDYYAVCACCGKEFHNRGGKNRVYCSHDCYINARFGKLPDREKEETAKPAPKSMKKSAPQFVETPQSDSCMSKKQSVDELAYRLIKSDDHHFKWWYENRPIRAIVHARPKGRCRKPMLNRLLRG